MLRAAPMAVNWQEVIVTVFTTIGGGTVLLGTAAYLIKTALAQRLLLDAEGFKAQLKTSADVEIERLKVSLQMSALEHQVRFSKLHEKRAEVIAELYRRLVELSMLAHQYAQVDNRSVFSLVPAGEDYEESDLQTPEGMRDNRDVFEKAKQKSRDLNQFMAFHKIYLPADIDGLFAEFWKASRRNFSIAAHEDRRGKNPYETDAYQDAIHKAEVALETEFRKLLGDKETTPRDGDK